MVRVKRGNVARIRRKKVLDSAQGFRGSQSHLIRTSTSKIIKALAHSYTGRRIRNAYFRTICINRLNANLRVDARSEFCLLLKNTSSDGNLPKTINYSVFKACLRNKKIGLNIKMLAHLAILDSDVFDQIISECKIRFR